MHGNDQGPPSLVKGPGLFGEPKRKTGQQRVLRAVFTLSKTAVVAYLFINPFLVSVGKSLQLLDLLDELFLFLVRSGGDVGLGKHPVDPLRDRS